MGKVSATALAQSGTGAGSSKQTEGTEERSPAGACEWDSYHRHDYGYQTIVENSLFKKQGWETGLFVEQNKIKSLSTTHTHTE